MKSSPIPSVLCKYMSPAALILKFAFACFEKETSLLTPKQILQTYFFIL